MTLQGMPAVASIHRRASPRLGMGVNEAGRVMEKANGRSFATILSYSQPSAIGPRGNALPVRAPLFGDSRIVAGLARTIQAAAADPDLDAGVVADGQHLVGAGLRLIVGPAADRESRRDPICGVEKETMIFQHDIHDAARYRLLKYVMNEVGRGLCRPSHVRELNRPEPD